MRTNWKLCLLGATAVLALTTTACEPSEGDGADAKPPATPTTEPATPTTEPASPTTEPATKSPTTPAGEDYSDRQTPPGPVCENDGEGPYGRLVGYLKDGTDDKEGNDLLSFHIGSYDCGDGSHPVLEMEGGGNHTTAVPVDEKHVKVVVAGQLADELGGREVDAQRFLGKLAEMEKAGRLGIDQDPLEFYFQLSGDSAVDPYEGGRAVYLYQVNTLGG
ncbi:hypothetical protein H9Y04_28670 [Streptomyces sp. TRM66268-LWL]|uniref:Lipoprotein n=1 Tax=Streptomyces polyasparticus TaxID=2767826 RepID=A0ABR7SQA3_9ACTN|nr:hypothetical protein [Streptomyces polyasparticus]MBC9716513.1 hypothetical protein [Streptomyces polyasparticus]